MPGARKPLVTKRQLSPPKTPRRAYPLLKRPHPFHSRRLADAVPVVPFIENADAFRTPELPVALAATAALATAGRFAAMGPDEDQVATAWQRSVLRE